MLSERGVLIRGPFIKHINRFVFQHRCNISQSFSLACGKISIGEFSVNVSGLSLQFHVTQKTFHLFFINGFQTVQFFEQIKVGKNNGKQLAIALIK